MRGAQLLEYLRALRSGAVEDADTSLSDTFDGIAVPDDVDPVLARRFVLGEELMREMRKSYLPPEEAMRESVAPARSTGTAPH